MATKNEFYRDFSYRKPYNDVPCKEDEVLVPFVTTFDEARYYRFNMENLETWKFYGKKVLVGFTPIRASAKDLSMKLFNNDVHEYLSRFSNKSDDISLDQMMDDINDPDKSGKDPTGTTVNEDLALLYMALDMLIAYYDKCQQPRKSSCIKMLSEGYSKQEIAEQVTPELKKSRAYEFIQQTQKEGLQLFHNQFHLK
jgi:hypothetical protein